MRQKIILMLFLIIGSSGCDKDVDPAFMMKFYYINHTGEDIAIDVYHKEFTGQYFIGNNDTLLLENNEITGKINYIEQYSDSVVVTYNNNKTTFYWNTPTSPMNIENYKQVGKDYYTSDYYYIFE